MAHILSIVLMVVLAAILLVLVTGVAVFVKGGELNRRYGNKLMNLRTGTQGLAILILGILLLLHMHFG